MSASLVEWQYDSVNGEIVDVYLFESEIRDIPVTEAELLDISCHEALARDIASQEQSQERCK